MGKKPRLPTVAHRDLCILNEQVGQAFEAMAECGLSLRQRYGFPDARCAQDSPMSEYDRYPGRLETDEPSPQRVSVYGERPAD